MSALVKSTFGLPVRLDSRVYSWLVDGSTWQTLGSTESGLSIDDRALEYDPVDVYRTQRSIRTVVGFLARNIAQVALKGYRHKEGDDRERLERAHPLAQLLARPSPTETPYEFVETMATDLCIWNRYAAVKVDQHELVRLPPDTWVFERNGRKQPIGVALATGKTLSLDRLLWFDGYPGGGRPLDSLVDLLIEEQESGKYRTQLWRNGTRLGGWITRPVDAPRWSKPARERFRTSWRSNYGGYEATRAGGTPILEEGMEYHEAIHGVTPEAAQQIEARKLSTSEAAAAFYVPPVFVGILDDATYSNVTAYREILYSDTLGPWFSRLGQGYQNRLVPDFGDPDLFVDWNVGEKLRMSFDEQTRIFQTATGAPIMTRNEARQRLNLTRIEGADELIVPLNVLSGGQASPTDATPPAS